MNVGINDDERTLEISNASTSLILYDLASGPYMVEASYSGNNYFYSASEIQIFLVLSNKSGSNESGTFSELHKIIDNTPEGGSVNLTKDYIFAYGDNDII